MAEDSPPARQRERSLFSPPSPQRRPLSIRSSSLLASVALDLTSLDVMWRIPLELDLALAKTEIGCTKAGPAPDCQPQRPEVDGGGEERRCGRVHSLGDRSIKRERERAATLSYVMLQLFCPTCGTFLYCKRAPTGVGATLNPVWVESRDNSRQRNSAIPYEDDASNLQRRPRTCRPDRRSDRPPPPNDLPPSCLEHPEQSSKTTRGRTAPSSTASCARTSTRSTRRCDDSYTHTRRIPCRPHRRRSRLC